MYLDGYQRSSLIPVSKLILTIRIFVFDTDYYYIFVILLQSLCLCRRHLVQC